MTGEPIGVVQARFTIDGGQDEANALAEALEWLASQVRRRPPVSAEIGYQRVADLVVPEGGAALNARYSNVAVEVQW